MAQLSATNQSNTNLLAVSSKQLVDRQCAYFSLCMLTTSTTHHQSNFPSISSFLGSSGITPKGSVYRAFSVNYRPDSISWSSWKSLSGSSGVMAGTTSFPRSISMNFFFLWRLMSNGNHLHQCFQLIPHIRYLTQPSMSFRATDLILLSGIYLDIPKKMW